MVQEALPSDGAPAPAVPSVERVAPASLPRAEVPASALSDQVVHVEATPLWRAAEASTVAVAPPRPPPVRSGLTIGHLHVEIMREARTIPIPASRPAPHGPEPVRVTDHMLTGRS